MENDNPNQYNLITPKLNSQGEKNFMKRYSEIQFSNDDQKQEALLKYWKEKKEKLTIFGKGNDELNHLLEKFNNWKDSFYKPIRYGSVSGSIFSLLCISFGSSK
jgi:single-stranded DNA-specific DHH superfamily exonuclease